MNKLTALVEAAKAATPGPWHSPGLGEVHAENHDVLLDVLFNDGSGEDSVGNGRQVDADYVALANPATILELCALLEKAEEAMEKYHACFDMLTDGPDESDQALAMSWLEQGRELRKEYLAAIKQWKEQT